MIDRYLLRYFLAVIDRGNFSKAAALCNVSQPTLSVGIAKLEADLGQALFLRTNRRVEVTEAGARLAVHARRIEAEFALAERSAKGASVVPVVRFGILATTPPEWVEHFLARQPAFAAEERVEVVEGRERDLIERLNRGRIDVALSITGREARRLPQEPLFAEGYALALASGHPLAGSAAIVAGDLANDTMIVRRQCELLPETSRFFTSRGVRPFFAARTMSDSRAFSYVRSGIGVTVMPDCFTGPGVARVPMVDFDFTRQIGLVFASADAVARWRQGPAVRALVSAVEAARAAAE